MVTKRKPKLKKKKVKVKVKLQAEVKTEPTPKAPRKWLASPFRLPWKWKPKK